MFTYLLWLASFPQIKVTLRPKNKSDTQLQKSAPLREVSNLTKELNPYKDDIKTWMTENQFKFNDEKTKALLLPFFVFLKILHRFLP